MDMLQLMKERHSVRQYKDKPIEQEKRAEIDRLISEINSESGLSMQAVYDEPNCFDSFMAHYGKFTNVSNYIAIVGAKNDQEKAGYYGEKLVLGCQELGLNTCWVAMSHGKTRAVIGKGQKLLIVIALGYGENQGVAHKSKDISEISSKRSIPAMFRTCPTTKTGRTAGHTPPKSTSEKSSENSKGILPPGVLTIRLTSKSMIHLAMTRVVL